MEDPVTVADINLVRDWGVQLSDFVSRMLGKARDPITAAIIVGTVAAYGYDVMHTAV